jgi:hypothetical protein
MMARTTSLCILAVVCLAMFALPVQAQDDGSPSAKVIYQNTFTSDPHWTTNNPSSDYWDPTMGRYHFSIEPSTGNYAYTTVNYFDGPFTFEYDVILERVDEGATFRFGLTGADMDFNKGPNVFSMFTNAKFGRIMWLHLVTPGNKQMEVNSQNGDALTSGSTAYNGPTVKYELNKTYHVTTTYDNEKKTLTMRVSEKMSGQEIWSYFLNTAEDLHGMDHIYLGSRGDYGSMYIYARGYIDNVKLTVPGPAVTPEQTFGTTAETTAPVITTRKPTIKPTTLPASLPANPPASPAGALPVLTALGVTGTLSVLCGMRKH